MLLEDPFGEVVLSNGRFSTRTSGSVYAHWSASGWNVKVSHVYKEEYSDMRAKLLQMLPDLIPSDEEERDRSM